MSEELRFKGRNDGTLCFRITTRHKHETEFEVSVLESQFRGHVETSTSGVGPPTTLFDEMAKNWNGWEGKKTWADSESRCSFTAFNDPTGHIKLCVHMDQINSGSVSVLEFEVGQLDYMAEQLALLFGR